MDKSDDYVTTYEIAGIVIDVYRCEDWMPRSRFIAHIWDGDHREVGDYPLQAAERVFFDYCDRYVAALVPKEGGPS